MRKYFWQVVTTVGLALALALPVAASDIFFPGGALETAVSNSCTRTVNVGTNHRYTTMDCTQTGTQAFTLMGMVNPDANTTFQIHIWWHTTSASASNVCWNVANAVCTTGVSTCDWDAITPTNTTATNPTQNIGANALMKSSFTGSATLYRDTLLADCTGTNCAGFPFVIKVDRDNSGSCTSNLAATAKVTGIRVEFL